MTQDEYDKVEGPAISQLQQLGWSYLPGALLAPAAGAINGAKLTPDVSGGTAPAERTYISDVVLSRRLEAAVKRINPWINDENLRKVVREVTHPLVATQMEANHLIYKTLVNYQSVEQDLGKGRKGQTVKLIDFDRPNNNEFLCTNQFTVQGVNQKIIPDIICFVNGLPLAVIECKSPYITNPVSEGINQLRRYANLRYPHTDEGAEKLFWYNQLMVSTARDGAKIGTISSSSSHYGEWKDAYPYTDNDLLGLNNPTIDPTTELNDIPSAAYLEDAKQVAGIAGITAQQRLLAGVFTPSAFLDLIQNFILYEPIDGRLIKKVARYQQFRAVNKVIHRLKNGKDRKEKSGVIWHTQGSGKSLTMVMLAVKMRRDPELQQYKLVFITDRTQLDAQLSTTFRDAQGETVYNAGSVAELKTLLKKDASDIVTAMVQKFQDAEKEGGFSDLNPSDKIIVLADEAHRTQFGGLAMTINTALPNAPKIGFTGTPLLKTQKMGHAFGGYIDQYKINEAVEDGATVRIIYEGRQVKTQVAGDSLDALFDEYFVDKSAEEKVEIKRKYGVEKAVREAPARIRWVCLDLIKHYREHIQPDGFKAMIVVGSRHAATVFKKTLDEMGAPLSEVIISGNHNDVPEIAQYTDKTKQKQTIKDFTKPLSENPTAILIVKDMLLTGFDAPNCQVMYIDRSLKEHTLMQAIARVNRTYKGKDCGYVVDYYGLSDHLTEALELFSSDDVEGTYHTLKDEIPKLKACHTRAISFFKEVASNDVDDYVAVLKDEDIRAQFEVAFKRFAKQMNIVLPDKAAAPFIADLKLLGKVNNAARLRYRDEQLDISDAGEKVRLLVDEHILSTGVDPKIPPIDLLAANFKDHLNGIQSDESKASEIESAIKHHITINLDEDPEYYKSLSLRLRDIIEKTAGKWDQQLDLLFSMMDTIKVEHQQAAQELGLSETEYAFYNILMAEVARIRGDELLDETTHDEIKAITQALVIMLDDATGIVDFFQKEDAVRGVQKKIKRTIVDSNFDDKDLRKAVMDRFMELAKVKFG
jgi:type I restriction enzyme R subunit